MQDHIATLVYFYTKKCRTQISLIFRACRIGRLLLLKIFNLQLADFQQSTNQLPGDVTALRQSILC